jgi:group I intron endonuclease
MKPEYNFCPIARSSRGRPISDETRRKLSLARIGKQPSLGRVQHSSEIEKRAMAIRGKKRSDVVKAMIGEKTSQYIRTSAHNKKLSENSTNKRSVLMIDKNTNEVINEFDSITDARIFLGKSSHAPIQKCCSGKVKTAYGYKWDYRNEGQKIIVKNQNGNLLGKYNSFTEIATMFKKSRTYIKMF